MRSPLWEVSELPRDVWDRIADSRLPLVVYGMGNGADKLVARLTEKGLPVSDFFASDGFVRGQSFHGKRVLTYDEICARYPSHLVLLAFASNRPEVLSSLYALSEKTPFLMPDLPVAGETVFDRAFLEAHLPELRAVAALLADDASRRILDAVLRYKLTGEISYLRETGRGRADLSEILHPARYRRALDGGAYTGDTAARLLDSAPGLRGLVAVEPDARNFRRLVLYAQNERRSEVQPLHAALSDRAGEAFLSSSGNRNTTLGTGSYQHRQEIVPTVTVDSLERPSDFIKLDVEGAERAALLGARKTILRDKPELLVSVYHRSEDLFGLPLLLAELCPSYRFYLRRDECLPAWELNLLAVPE